MSQYLERMSLGDTIEVKGPLGHFVYEGRGAYRNSGASGSAKTMSMIAGGTGITPMFQIIKVCPSGTLVLQLCVAGCEGFVPACNLLQLCGCWMCTAIAAVEDFDGLCGFAVMAYNANTIVPLWDAAAGKFILFLPGCR